jgi:thiol-disulfide isomerase/thioredoxin
MKRLIVINLFLFCLTLLYARETSVMFLNKTIPEIIKEAQVLDRLIFIDMTATWCGPCKEMDKTTFKDSMVVNYFSSNFLCKKIFLENDSIYVDSLSLYFKNETKTVPSFYFLDNQGNIILNEIGSKTATELLELGRKAKSMKSPEYEISKMKLGYSTNMKNKDFLLKFMQLKNITGEKDTVALNDYLKLIPEQGFSNDTIVYTIIKNEKSIYGKGYRIISSKSNQTWSTIEANNKNIKNKAIIGYDMYKTSLDIIYDNIQIALIRRDKQLFKDCIVELNSVMQDKDRAKEITKQVETQFESEE